MTRKTFHLIRLVLLLVATLTMGLHYAVVQMVGWVNMTVEYSQTAPLSEALVMTFDGKHPCELCKLVEKELETSDQDDQRAPKKKPPASTPASPGAASGMAVFDADVAESRAARGDGRSPPEGRKKLRCGGTG